MGKTREIKKRIKAVGNIRRITKTMQMIATSKFARAQQASVASKPYTEALFELVTQLASGLSSDVSHPLLESGKAAKGASAGKELTLVITSDRGLCGPYNGSVLRSSMQFFKSNPSAKIGVVEASGKKGVGFFKFAGVSLSKLHAIGDKPKFEQIQELADDYMARFSSGEISRVRVVYMRYISASRQAATVMQLLPFQTDGLAKKDAGGGGAASAGTKAGSQQVFEFSPDANGLLESLLPAAVRAMLFQAFNDSVVSEHVARMVAMKSATDNAGKAGKRLTRVYNRARQAQITTELTEIISGAAALA